MTLDSINTTTKLEGDGANKAWDFNFVVWDAATLQIWVFDADGVSTKHESDWSAVLNADQDADPGGTVTFPVAASALAVGESIVIMREMTFKQPVDFQRGQAFDAEVLERMADVSAAERQQILEQLGRCIYFGPGQVVTDYLNECQTAQVSATASEATATWMASVAVTAASEAEAAADQVAKVAAGVNVDVFVDGVDYTAGGTDTELTLSASPLGSAHDSLIVFFDAATIHITEYSVAEDTITFDSAIPAGVDQIMIIIYGSVAINVVADGAISEAKIQVNAVTTYKLDDDAVTTAKIADNAISTAKLAHATQGDLLYYATAGVPTHLTLGAAKQQLRVNAAATGVEWKSYDSHEAYVRAVGSRALNVLEGANVAWGATKALYNLRLLNYLSDDDNSIASFYYFNKLRLPAGLYRCNIECPVFAVSSHKAILYNDTDSAILLESANAYARYNYYGFSNASIRGRFTLTGAKDICLRHYTETVNSAGLGRTTGVGGNEFYSVAEFWKEA